MNECKICNNQFEAKRSDAQYCSKKCKKRAEYLRKPAVKRPCDNCGKSFETRRKDTAYCGIACSNVARTRQEVSKSCELCGENFTVEFIKRNRRFCSRSCASKHTNSTVDREKVNKKISQTQKMAFRSEQRVHPQLGRSIKESTKKKTRKTRERNGLNLPENNPMFGKNHSKETRERMSETRTEKILNGEYSSWFDKGKHYSIKLDKEVAYRSSWEKAVYEILDKDDNVKSYTPEPFKIPYVFEKVKRHYIPDLLVEYSDSTKKLVEIKPKVFINHSINKAKFDAAKKYCKNDNLVFEIWTEKFIDKTI
jgi:hypothetical protein